MTLHPRAAALMIVLLPLLAPAQETEEEIRQLIEDVIAQQAEEGGEFTFNAAFSVLDAYARRPLDLNAATADELGATYLLTPNQIDALLAYRERMNGLMSIYELQVVPGMDLETIRRLLPFVRVGNGLDAAPVPLGRLLSEGRRELFLRGSRRLERGRGYTEGRYAGDPWRLYTKYRQRYGTRLSLGLVAEKDPGERLRPDYLSAHFFMRDPARRVKALAVGDFSVSFGQGLILYTGFGFGKSSLTTSVMRRSPTLQPYASVNEFSFMRGVGTTLELRKGLELTVFGSTRRRTGNLIDDDRAVSSLSETGLHRTDLELEDRRSVRQTSYGGSLRYVGPGRRLELGLNFLGERLSKPLERRPQPYNLFYFNGRRLHNASLDYRYRLRNFSFFGEGTENAMLHGLQLALDRRAEVAVVYRRYGRAYQALSARPFGEASGGRNEEGLYFGLEIRPADRWRVNAYYDLWRHPWLRFNIDAPTTGREYRLRVSYDIRRKLDAFLELRSETKGAGVNEDPLDLVVERTRFQARLHAGYKVTPELEWRSRLDLGFTEDVAKGRQTGVMLFQDLHYRPLGPFSFSARLAVFRTDGFDVRFYQYENNLTYNALVLPYYGEGARSFLLLRYKGPLRGLTLEGRIARTQNFDGRAFGSGLEATGKDYRTEVGVQGIYRF